MKIYVSDNWLSVVEAEVFVVGSIGVNRVEFVFDESWEGYSARAIFEMPGTTPIEVPLLDFNCEVPWEVLADVKKRFRIGIYGQMGDIRRPTLWTDYFPVSPGAGEGVAARPAPTPDVYEQLVESIAQAGNAKDHAESAAASAADAETCATAAQEAARRAESIVAVGGVQSDWNEEDEASLAFVKNKPGTMDPAVYDPEGHAEDIFAYALPRTGGAVTGPVSVKRYGMTARLAPNDSLGNCAELWFYKDNSPEGASLLMSESFLQYMCRRADSSILRYDIYHTGNKPTPAEIGAALPPKVVTVTLPAAAWDTAGLTQTVDVTGVTADNLITPAPKPDSWVEAGNCGVYASAQDEDALTFTCRAVPAADLTYTVVIQEV